MALIQNLRTAGVTQPIVVNDAIDSPDLRKLSEADVYYVTMSMLPGDMEFFGDDYLNAFGGDLIDIPSYTAESYDATVMCIKAFNASLGRAETTQQARIWNAIEEEITANKLSYSRSYTSFDTITGPYDYDNERNFKYSGTYYVGQAGNNVVKAIKKYGCEERVPDSLEDRTCEEKSN